MKELSRAVGRELDAMIAEKVMGGTWRVSDQMDRFVCERRGLAVPTETLVLGSVTQCWRSHSGELLAPNEDGVLFARYSTDIAAAFLVVEKLRERSIAFTLFIGTVECLAAFDDLTNDWTRESHRPVGEEAAAICEAALRALAALAPLEAVLVKEGEG